MGIQLSSRSNRTLQLFPRPPRPQADVPRCITLDGADLLYKPLLDVPTSKVPTGADTECSYWFFLYCAMGSPVQRPPDKPRARRPLHAQNLAFPVSVPSSIMEDKLQQSILTENIECSIPHARRSLHPCNLHHKPEEYASHGQQKSKKGITNKKQTKSMLNEVDPHERSLNLPAEQKVAPVENEHSKYSISLIKVLLCVTLMLIPIYLMSNGAPWYKKDNCILIGETCVLESTAQNKADEIWVFMQNLEKNFSKQTPHVWKDIFSAIYNSILNPKKPSMLLFFGNEGNTINCLAQQLGKICSKVLGTKDYLTLTAANIGHDTGEVISSLKPQIEEKKTVVVKDLLSINSNALKAFHNFCDRENPLVRQAMYIITIPTKGYDGSQKELEFIEDYIIKKLSSNMEQHILDPLMIRITEGPVINVHAEQDQNLC